MPPILTCDLDTLQGPLFSWCMFVPVFWCLKYAFLAGHLSLPECPYCNYFCRCAVEVYAFLYYFCPTKPEVPCTWHCWLFLGLFFLPMAFVIMLHWFCFPWCLWHSVCRAFSYFGVWSLLIGAWHTQCFVGVRLVMLFSDVIVCWLLGRSYHREFYLSLLFAG